MYIEFLTLIRQ